MQVRKTLVESAPASGSTPAPVLGRLLRSGLGSTVRTPELRDDAGRTSSEGPAVAWDATLEARIADSPTQAALARDLVRRRYYRAGYRMMEDDGYPFPGAARAPQYFPIVAASGEMVVGTVTLGVDSPAGLLVDDAHKIAADRIRGRGGRLCELVRLAIEADVDSKGVLASLLQCVYTTCTEVFDLTDVLIEVVPQHVDFYRRLFGFARASEIRLCERVGGVASLVLSLQRSELERRLGSLTRH